MLKRKQYGEQAERELGEVFLRMPAKDGPREICPTTKVLGQFVAGSIAEESTLNRILAHLAVCPKCVDTVVRLRNRRLLIRRSSLVLIASFLIAVILWIWPLRAPIHSTPLVVLDLRETAPTRSNQHGKVSPVRVGAETRQLRIVLPEVSEEGAYEIEVLSGVPGSLPVLHNAASTTKQGHNVELTVALDFSKTARGNYVLAIRRDNSGWDVPILKE